MSNNEAATPRAESEPEETFHFQAEINQLMSLIINTFYTKKDIFLRELVSNSSDALDKIRFHSLTDKSVLKDEAALEIRIKACKEESTLTIQDTGIGMTRQELITNLGTIAKSGTRGFMEALKTGDKDLSMIGQFGVGFYAAYLVADRVQVVSKHRESSHPYVWESCAGGEFTVRKCSGDEHPDLKRGTKIILHLKEDQRDYLQESRVQALIKEHSEFIQYPIFLFTTKEKEVEREIPDEDQGQDNDEDVDDKVVKKEDNDEDVDDKVVKKEDNAAVEDADEEEQGQSDQQTTSEKKTKKVKETVEEWQELNSQKAIWTKNPDDVSEEEYTSFYKSISGDWEGPMAHRHFKAEGNLEFTALVYIPKRAPFDLFAEKKKQDNFKLYVKRVFITADSGDFIPEWCNFVKGVVDSEDLPLNISRETFQASSVLKSIKKTLVKKVIGLLNELAEDTENPQKFAKIWEEFGKNIKFGVYSDHTNRSKLLKLVRWASSHESEEKQDSPDTTGSGSGMTTLDDYVGRMKTDQKDIYYITGQSLDTVKESPFCERFNKLGYEILYLVDPIDEYLTQQVRDYDGHKLVNITREGLELPESSEEKLTREKQMQTHERLLHAIKRVLSDKIDRVSLSDKLVSSPCCLVASQWGYSANMERIVRSQALGSGKDVAPYMTKKSMEINPDHPLIKQLVKNLDNSEESGTDAVPKNSKDLIQLLYETSLLSSGYSLESPASFTERIHRLLAVGLTDFADAESQEDVGEGTVTGSAGSAGSADSATSAAGGDSATGRGDEETDRDDLTDLDDLDDLD